MNTGSPAGKLNIQDLKLSLFVFLFSFFGYLVPVLTVFQQGFNLTLLAHGVFYALVGGLVAAIVQFLKNNQ